MTRTTDEPVSSEQPATTDVAKREKRRAANRRSARKSRYREMVMLDELQHSARNLHVKNGTLKEENDSLRNLISSLKNFTSDQKVSTTPLMVPYPMGVTGAMYGAHFLSSPPAPMMFNAFNAAAPTTIAGPVPSASVLSQPIPLHPQFQHVMTHNRQALS